MKFLHVLFLAVLVLTPVYVQADDGVELIGIQAEELNIVEKFLAQFGGVELAIVTDKGFYSPGETAKLEIVSNVPCNAKYVILTVDDGSMKNIFYKDISDIMPVCVTSRVFVSVKVPATPGAYTVAASYKDGSGNELYRDASPLTVKDPNAVLVCPNGYCTSWSHFQDVPNGEVEVKTCYLVDSKTCEKKASASYRLDCKSGYEAKGNDLTKCYPLPTTAPVCGNKIVEAGEQCDNGGQNNWCPSTCNSFCQVSSCSSLPIVESEDDEPQEEEESNIVFQIIGGLLAATGVGVLIYWRYK